MERLIEIKTHVTGFCYADKKEGVFVQDVFAKLAAYEDTGLTPEQIQAQQQEIDMKKIHIELLQQGNKNYQEYAKSLEQQIDALVADKDEQAGKLMRYDTVLKQAREVMNVGTQLLEKYIDRSEQTPEEDACIEMQETIAIIDALLGGAES